MSDSPEIQELTALRARCAQLEETLKFYADPQTYGLHGGSSTRIMADHGNRASKAVKSLKESNGKASE